MSQPALIQAMLQADFYPHPVAQCELVETHISWVILTGEYAYKVKKPLDLGFLDFSTLARRQHCCEEELRLNRRLAPQIYQEVVGIGGSAQAPVYGAEPAIEYAVRMHQFDGGGQFDRLLAQGRLDGTMIEATARCAAEFHAQIDTHPPAPLGSPEQVWQPMADNFTQIRALPLGMAQDRRLAELEQWSQTQYQGHRQLLQQRLEDGFVRECHGDMHLANMAWLDGEALIFDGIEFSPALRWIDIISEVAFAVMDLEQHRRPELAWRFLNVWLEHSGDYAGLALLEFYLVYRAMVRAKIAAIRLSQLEGDDPQRGALRSELDSYLALAQRFTQPRQPKLLICHGPSGVGKTVLGMALLAQLGGIRLRSDVERKRLHGLTAQQRGEQALYQPEITEQTYRHLAEVAQGLLQQGRTVLVDATFLDPGERGRFRQLAAQLGCPFQILSFQASEATLRQRLMARREDASDANIAVLEKQLASFEPLGPAEQQEAIVIDTQSDDPLKGVLVGSRE